MARLTARSWRRALVAVLVFAGLGFIAALAWNYRVEMAAQLAGLDWTLTLAALGALLTSTLGMALVFSELVRDEASTDDSGTARLMSAFLLSQIAKYVPGRVWGPVLQGAAVGPALSLQRLVRINLDVAAMAAVVTLGTASALVGWTAWGRVAGMPLFVVTIALACLVLELRPSIRLQAMVGKLIPRLRGDAPVDRARPGAARLRGVVGVVLFVAGYGIGWLALVLAVTRGPLDDGMRLTAMLSVSYLVGLLSMLPAGLGAREAFLVASSAWMKADLASLALLAIVTRLAMVLVDLLSLPIALVLLLSARRIQAGPRP